MTADKDNTIAQLQAEIKRRELDAKAMAAELNSIGTDDADNPTPDSATLVIKKALGPKVPEYIRNIHNLAEAAESESVQLQANKLLIEWAVTNKLDAANPDADDDFKNLLKKITQSKTKMEGK